MEEITILWTKREARLRDNPSLNQALELGIPILVLFLVEPSQGRCADHSPRHFSFQMIGWKEYAKALESLGAHCLFAEGEIEEVLIFLSKYTNIRYLISRFEIGNHASYERDQKLKKFCKELNCEWLEPKSQFAIRGLKSGRKGWPEKWKQWMSEPLVTPKIESNSWWRPPKEILENRIWKTFSVKLQLTNSQIPGESGALDTLQSFLDDRARHYSGCISKPHESRTHCSRLSTYLAWGQISSRYVYQLTKSKQLNSSPFLKRQFERFLSRLFWRDHMIQKFESESRIEFENFNRAYDLLPKSKNLDLLQAWETGNTGYPLVDACMRCLVKTGYLNFRMRAMLVSFLTMILWQDWREGVHHLSRLFLDYEPGIHYFQFQMQAGSVGNHQIRIYNPYKQSLENDPDCHFIRDWIPELSYLPNQTIHSWGIEESLFGLSSKYPKPIVEFTKAYKKAKELQFAFRKNPLVQKELREIRKKHVIGERERSPTKLP